MGEWGQWENHKREMDEALEDSWLDWGEDLDRAVSSRDNASSSDMTTTAPQEPSPDQTFPNSSSNQGTAAPSQAETMPATPTDPEEIQVFSLLVQALNEPFEYLSPYMGNSLFFNLMHLNFTLIVERIAKAYLAEIQQTGMNPLPPEREREYIEALKAELKSSENRIWDYIMWLREVVEAKKRQEEEPPPPDWIFDWW